MITTVENRRLRSRILEVCIQIQQALLDDSNRRISALLESNGEPLAGIATGSPLYQAAKGLKKGDTFQRMRVSYTITDIF